MPTSTLNSLKDTLELSPQYYALVLLVLLLLPLSLIFDFHGLTQRKSDAPGCSKVGIRVRSQLADQFSKTYDEGQQPGKDAKGNPSWRVKALFCYPIKSCRPVELWQTKILGGGLEYDRCFCFAEFHQIKPKDKEQEPYDGWEIITQRGHPKMNHVNVEVWRPDPNVSSYREDGEYIKANGCLVISFPVRKPVKYSICRIDSVFTAVLGKLSSLSPSIIPHQTFRVPFEPSDDQIKSLKLKPEVVKVHGSQGFGLDMSPTIPPDALASLKSFLNVNPDRKFTLFRTNLAETRYVRRCAEDFPDRSYEAYTGFQDSFPLHINNIMSLHDVERHMPAGFGKLSAMRFRSNIYVQGPPAYSEDDWRKIRIGEVGFNVACRTTRCQLPSVDPHHNDPFTRNVKKPNEQCYGEPFKTLKGYRCIDEGAQGQPCLGMQMVPALDKEQIIRVGDELVVEETGKHYFK